MSSERLTFTVQNDACGEFDTGRLFSHSSIKRWKFLYANITSNRMERCGPNIKIQNSITVHNDPLIQRISKIVRICCFFFALHFIKLDFGLFVGKNKTFDAVKVASRRLLKKILHFLLMFYRSNLHSLKKVSCSSAKHKKRKWMLTCTIQVCLLEHCRTAV